MSLYKLDTKIKERFKNIEDKIKKTANLCGRDYKEIKLIAVSKKKPVSMIKDAIDAGAKILGENYIQEAAEKIKEIDNYNNVIWHFIGSLQRNKAKYAVRLFDLIHSVDSFKLAKEVDKESAKINKVQKVLIQVNISGETSKSGIEPDKCFSLAKQISSLKNISVIGLMAVPQFLDDQKKTRPFFVRLRRLAESLEKEKITNISMKELSMGMTSDFEAAILEGATYVRIGTAIFGDRV